MDTNRIVIGGESYHVATGDKITQLLVVPIMRPVCVVVEAIDGGERGDGGFGSTGR